MDRHRSRELVLRASKEILPDPFSCKVHDNTFPVWGCSE